VRTRLAGGAWCLSPWGSCQPLTVPGPESVVTSGMGAGGAAGYPPEWRMGDLHVAVQTGLEAADPGTSVVAASTQGNLIDPIRVVPAAITNNL
jgi:hypothetical protein